MVYDPDDTIVAVGTAAGGAPRGMIRLSGPRVVACLEKCFQPTYVDVALSGITTPRVIPGAVVLSDQRNVLPSDLFLWPTAQSYTRQPSAELHTLGSPPLLQEVIALLCNSSARLAQPGEFTMRAFLAGRLDLTQAEAVLGVIDSQSSQQLQSSLSQLAGGLSSPLSRLREELLQLLAELEAGLDFVEEDIEFITQDQLRMQISAALALVTAVKDQLIQRESSTELPRVVLSGAPNAGKSSLFNALIERYGSDASKQHALVSEQSGTTRDFVSATLRVSNFSFELIDTAGIEAIDPMNGIGEKAQAATTSQRQQAEIVLRCADGSLSLGPEMPNELLVVTKCDLINKLPSESRSWLACSSVTGHGLNELAAQVVNTLKSAAKNSTHSQQLTASRCKESLSHTELALTQALELVHLGGGEELIAAEVRAALHALGQVVGTVYTDDILDRIFGQFCIGK